LSRASSGFRGRGRRWWRRSSSGFRAAKAVEPGRELRWLGRLLVPGIVDGEHILRIESLDQARSRFTQAERFSGILVGLFRSTLDKTELGFEQMNAALMARAERR
jgi:hypothetical protein